MLDIAILNTYLIQFCDAKKGFGDEVAITSRIEMVLNEQFL